MFYYQYAWSTVKKISKYLLWVVLISWVIVSFILWYFYLLSTASQTSKKGGTFVEGIFDQVSYLPYLKNDSQSIFYQDFLFRSCLNPYEKDENGIFESDLCKVYTEDNKLYTLRLLDEESTWNDWVSVTIDDIFFTYDEILRQNKWGIKSLNTWNNIIVSLEWGKVKIEFPNANLDNINFFTNYILPKHILGNASLDEYRTNFATSPVYNDCASILSQNKDINSLIFDLSKCQNTNFSYYQIKNYWSFENFSQSLMNGEKSIVDVYQSPYAFEGFTGKNILTSKLIGVFFNTDSEKVKVRLRRALGWFIHSNFYTGNYQQYLKKYDGEFLNYYVTDGENVEEFINRMNLTDSEINTQDLKDSWAKELPESISINGVDRKFIFFLQKPDWSRNLEIKFSNEFENIKITAPDGSIFTPKSYNKKDKKVTYKLTTNENLHVGSNQYTISGVIKGKTYTIASIDLYVFESLASQNTEENKWKLNVLYYSEPSSIFVAQQMRTMFKDAGILENFIFEEVFNPEELEGKLLMGSYDLYIWSVDLWSKNDVLALFSTEDVLLNPSKYRNPILTSLIKQYTKNPGTNLKGEINVVLAQDMPLILLGATFTPLQMKEGIANTVFSGYEYLYDELRRHQIYRDYSIVHNVRINPSEAFNWNNFVSFILNNIPSLPSSTPSSDFSSVDMDNNETSQNLDPFEGLIAHPEEREISE